MSQDGIMESHAHTALTPRVGCTRRSPPGSISIYREAKETLHARYKDSALVEQAFRTSKTVHLEMRPWFVQIERNTRGHALKALSWCNRDFVYLGENVFSIRNC